MADYTLDATEVVLLKADRIGYRTRQRSEDRVDLVLTNRRLIFVKRLAKVFGSTKEVVANRIGQIKVFSDQAQVVLGSGTDVEIQLVSGAETVAFESRRAATKWVDTINLLATGREDEVRLNPSGKAISGAVYVSETLRDTVNTFKGVFGPKPEAPVKTAQRCTNCGGPVQGYVGKVVTCPHCGHPQHLDGSTTSPPAPAATTPPVMAASTSPPPPPRQRRAPTIPSAAVPPPPPGAVPAPVAEPGWKTDPRGRHEYRWWDGHTWTALVADHGVTANDPV